MTLVYYGLIFVLPLSLKALDVKSEDGVKGVWDVAVTVLGEFPAIFIGYLVVEKRLFGRKNSMIYGFLVAGVALILSSILPGFVIWVGIGRAFLNFSFIIAAPYTSELYPTSIRATGLGIASAFSRLGGIAMPWFTIWLFEIGLKMPFTGYAVISLLTGMCVYMIKKETKGMPLDINYDEF